MEALRRQIFAGDFFFMKIRRRLNDWEVGDMADLIEMVNHVHPHQEAEDTIYLALYQEQNFLNEIPQGVPMTQYNA